MRPRSFSVISVLTEPFLTVVKVVGQKEGPLSGKEPGNIRD